VTRSDAEDDTARDDQVPPQRKREMRISLSLSLLSSPDLTRPKESVGVARARKQVSCVRKIASRHRRASVGSSPQKTSSSRPELDEWPPRYSCKKYFHRALPSMSILSPSAAFALSASRLATLTRIVREMSVIREKNWGTHVHLLTEVKKQLIICSYVSAV